MASHLARHEAGHILLHLRNEDARDFQDLPSLKPTESAWRRHLSAHMDDFRIERHTAENAPSPLSQVDHLEDALNHFRAELNYSKASWRQDIESAVRRTLTAANDVVRVIAYSAAELGLDRDGHLGVPETEPAGWSEYLAETWPLWSQTFHILRPVHEPMSATELSKVLGTLCKLTPAWLRSIGVEWDLTDEGEYCYWTRDVY